MIYLYDGTFTGLLSVFHDIFVLKNAPVSISVKKYVPDLFAELKKIVTSPEKAEDFTFLLESSFPPSVFRVIYAAFLSELSEFEMDLYRYLADGFEIGKDIEKYLHLDSVARVRAITAKVFKEAHNLKGFIRFSELKNGFLYSRIEPDHFVLPLIVSHFKKRFGNKNWVLHDAKRGRAAIYENGKVEFVDVLQEESPVFSQHENDVELLWKTFFDSVSIASRKNPKLQNRMLPRRYRKNMLEFK